MVIDEQIEGIRADELPSGIVIMAMASRLADLQTSRIDVAAAAINAPTSAPDAGRMAYVAENLLATMYRRLAEGDSGPVSVAVLTVTMTEEIEGLREEEVRFCIRFLNIDRDIRYQDLGASRWSRLLRYHPRFDYVKLTEAGRTWVRLLRQRSVWLFEDKDAEKIVVAIHSGEFDQIPPVCAELITNLRQYNEELTAIMESPSFVVLVGRYLRHRQRYGDMLTGCLDVTGQAMELLLTEAVRLSHEAWQAAAGMDMPVKAFYDWIERVHRATETPSGSRPCVTACGNGWRRPQRRRRVSKPT